MPADPITFSPDNSRYQTAINYLNRKGGVWFLKFLYPEYFEQVEVSIDGFGQWLSDSVHQFHPVVQEVIRRCRMPTGNVRPTWDEINEFLRLSELLLKANAHLQAIEVVFHGETLEAVISEWGGIEEMILEQVSDQQLLLDYDNLAKLGWELPFQSTTFLDECRRKRIQIDQRALNRIHTITLEIVHQMIKEIEEIVINFADFFDNKSIFAQKKLLKEKLDTVIRSRGLLVRDNETFLAHFRSNTFQFNPLSPLFFDSLQFKKKLIQCLAKDRMAEIKRHPLQSSKAKELKPSVALKFGLQVSSSHTEINQSVEDYKPLQISNYRGVFLGSQEKQRDVFDSGLNYRMQG